MIAIQAVALALALIVAGTLFSRRALLLYRLIRSGKPASRSGDLPARARAEAVVVVGQSKLLLPLVPGLVHAAIFWGFLVLFPTIVIAMIGAVDPHSTLPWLGTQGWSTCARCSCSPASCPRSSSARCSGRSALWAATSARQT